MIRVIECTTVMEYLRFSGRSSSLTVSTEEMNEILSVLPCLSFECSLLANPNEEESKIIHESKSLKSYLEDAWKYGSEVLLESDPFAAAANILSKSAVGNLLSKLSTTHCAGLMGMVVSTFAPQVPLIVFKQNPHVMNILDNNSSAVEKDKQGS